MLAGRAWVINEEKRLQRAFDRAKQINAPSELSADLAQHLVILVAGWMERSAFELARDYCQRKATGPIRSFSLSYLNKTRNPWVDELLNIVGRFDSTWETQLDGFITPDRKMAINSLMGLRNKIAHGEPWSANTSLVRVSDYYQDCSDVIHHIANIFDPVPHNL